MQLENIVMDCRDPARLAAFWTEALRLEPGYADADLVEARLSIPGGGWLDLCLQRVDTAPPAYGPGLPGPQLHLDLGADGDQRGTVDRLLALGAAHADIGQHGVSWEVLADPEGNLFCVLADLPTWAGTGPLADIPVDSLDPEADAAFWAAVSGWQRTTVTPGGPAIRHPSGLGTHVSFWEREHPKTGKNRLHLDVRPAPGEATADCLALALDLGATRVEERWAQGHSWTVLADPSGNEFCLLPAPSPAEAPA